MTAFEEPPESVTPSATIDQFVGGSRFVVVHRCQFESPPGQVHVTVWPSFAIASGGRTADTVPAAPVKFGPKALTELVPKSASFPEKL